MSALRIAIVGGGIAGLMAALLLSRHGHRISVFEQQANPSDSGSGLLLQPVALDALAFAELRQTVEAHGSRIDRFIRRNPDGRIEFELQYRELSQSSYALGIRRAVLCQALLDAVRARDVHIELATHIVHVQEHDRGIMLRDATGRAFDGYDVLIVCDGLRSRVRTCLPLPATSTPCAWGVRCAILRRPPELDGASLVQLFGSPENFVGFLPAGTLDGVDTLSFFWNARTTDPSSRPLEFAKWRSRMVSMYPQARAVFEQLTKLEQLTLSTYAEVRMERFHTRRAVVIGDAAHAVNPQLGMGANLALIDAVVLANCLKDVRTGDISAALARYQRLREPQLRYYQRASRALVPLIQSDAFAAAWSRNLAFGIGLPIVRRMALNGMSGYAQLAWSGA